MAQAKEGHTGPAGVVDDYDAICRVLQLCTEGEAKGDVAKLREALIEADLSGADLSGATLIGARLAGTNLMNANLMDAKGMTNEELERQAYSVEGATMPNGQKYEEWLKSKGRGEDGENGGPS